MTDSADYKALHPADVQDLKDNTPQVGSFIDITTGKAVNGSSGARLNLDKLPTPDSGVSNKIVLESSSDDMSEGERQPGWSGVYDIYWKLNWVRKELLDNNVPKDLRAVVQRTRKHSKRIRKEFTDRTVDKYLDAADTTLEYLEKGLDQMAICNQLTTSNIPWRSIPWGAMEPQIRQWLTAQGVLSVSSGGTSSYAGAQNDDDEDTTYHLRTPKFSQRTIISSSKGATATLVLDYASEHHSSPEEGARRAFEAALKSIIALRNLLNEGKELRTLGYPKTGESNADIIGDNYAIVGQLRQEPGSMIERPERYSSEDSTSTSSHVQIP